MHYRSEDDDFIYGVCEKCGAALKAERANAEFSHPAYLLSEFVRCPCGEMHSHILGWKRDAPKEHQSALKTNLTSCPDCNRPISREASSCPGCGFRWEKCEEILERISRGIFWCALWLFIIMLASCNSCVNTATFAAFWHAFNR